MLVAAWCIIEFSLVEYEADSTDDDDDDDEKAEETGAAVIPKELAQNLIQAQ